MPITSHMPGSAAQKVAPGQGQIGSHLQASQMAHAAASRAAATRVLSGTAAAPAVAKTPKPVGFKAHVLKVAGKPSGSVDIVHKAIAQGVQAGQFTPDQGAALTAHNGPLVGPKGAKTIATLGTIASKMKGP